MNAKRTKRDYEGATIEIDGVVSKVIPVRGRFIVRGECSCCNHTLTGQKRHEDDPSEKPATVDGDKVHCGNCKASYEITFAS
jgi:hypothetical protein